MELKIKDMRKELGMSQKEFAAYFEIPVKTIQRWEQEQHVPQEYIPKMIQRIIELEQKERK